MEWPRITPVKETRAQFDRVETCRHLCMKFLLMETFLKLHLTNVRYNPEYEPHGRPRLAYDHGDVLARQAKSCHPTITRVSKLLNQDR